MAIILGQPLESTAINKPDSWFGNKVHSQGTWGRWGKNCTVLACGRQVLSIRVLIAQLTAQVANIWELWLLPSVLQRNTQRGKSLFHILNFAFSLSPTMDGCFSGSISPRCPACKDHIISQLHWAPSVLKRICIGRQYVIWKATRNSV